MEIMRQADYYGLPEPPRGLIPPMERLADQLAPPVPWSGPMKVGFTPTPAEETRGYWVEPTPPTGGPSYESGSDPYNPHDPTGFWTDFREKYEGVDPKAQEVKDRAHGKSWLYDDPFPKDPSAGAALKSQGDPMVPQRDIPVPTHAPAKKAPVDKNRLQPEHRDFDQWLKKEF